MTTTITGCSDDLIEIDGDVHEELSAPGWKDDFEEGYITCSDGTALRFEYDRDGIWRFVPVVKGGLFDHVEQGSVPEDTFDVVHFKDGLKWVAMSDPENFVQ